LSHRIVAKIKKDNCTIQGNLRGYNTKEYNANSGRLIRAFFGHTRFATSSKASFEGTHPHLWSKRRNYRIYDANSNQSTLTSVENYITHNGDFEFFKVNGKYYDVEVVQHWLEHVLGCPMPATVDSSAIAGVIDVLRSQGSFALSARYALCLECSEIKVESEPICTYPTIEEYEVIAEYFEEAMDKLLNNGGTPHSKTSLGQCSKDDMRAQLSATVTDLIRDQLEQILSVSGTHNSTVRASSKGASVTSAMEKLSQFFSRNPEAGNSIFKFVRGTIDAFFDNDLLHSTRLFLENAKGSFGLCVVSSLDAGRQVCFAARLVLVFML
jgi:hypothetical protein